MKKKALTLSTIAVICCALLVFVSGKFILAETLGIKRLLQGLCFLPIAAVAFSNINSKPRIMQHPLILLVVLMLFVSIMANDNIAGISDRVFLFIGLIVIGSASKENNEYGIKTIILIATIFSTLALLQWLFLFADPSLAEYARTGYDYINNVYTKDFSHPISWLGSVPVGGTIFLGHSLVRLASYATEPSLLPVYFLIPASFALMTDRKKWRICAIPILIASLLSLSGSVFLSLFFAGFVALSVLFIGIKKTIRYTPIPLLAFLIVKVTSQGFDQFTQAFAYLQGFANFLERSRGFEDRTLMGLDTLKLALASPFGSFEVVNTLPFALIIKIVIYAGWLGLFFLIIYLFRLAANMERFYKSDKTSKMQRGSCILFAGVLFMILLFNDYQATTYPGIMLLMFAYRTMELRALPSFSMHKV
jgi:hypothetical protein